VVHSSISGRHSFFFFFLNRHVGTRTVIQVRTHAQKYFLKLEKSGAPAAGKGEGGSKGKDAEGTKATNSSDSGDEADDGGDDF